MINDKLQLESEMLSYMDCNDCALITQWSTLAQDTIECLILHAVPSVASAGTADNMLCRWLHYSLHQPPAVMETQTVSETLQSISFTWLVTQEDEACCCTSSQGLWTSCVCQNVLQEAISGIAAYKLFKAKEFH